MEAFQEFGYKKRSCSGDLATFYQTATINDLTVKGLLKLARSCNLKANGTRAQLLVLLNGIPAPVPEIQPGPVIIIPGLGDFDVIAPLTVYNTDLGHLRIIGGFLGLDTKLLLYRQLFDQIGKMISPNSRVRGEIISPVDSIPKLPCINPSITQPVMYYHEGKRCFAFTAQDVRLVREFQLNPYSGHQITASVLKDLGVIIQHLDVNLYDGRRLKFSEECSKWLNAYCYGTFMFSYKEAYRVPHFVRLECLSVKENRRHTLYRGMKDRHSKPSTTFDSLVPSSWSKSLEIAEGFANPGFVLQVEVDPVSILIDMTMVNAEVNNFKLCPSAQAEVVLLPGTYSVLVISGKLKF
jgi:hypothetical protein